MFPDVSAQYLFPQCFKYKNVYDNIYYNVYNFLEIWNLSKWPDVCIVCLLKQIFK